MENLTNIIYLISFIIALIGLGYLVVVIAQTFKKLRTAEFSYQNIKDYLLGFLVMAPVVAAIYYLPIALGVQDFWSVANAKYQEVQLAVKLFALTLVSFYALVRLAIFLPHENEYYNIVPKLLLLSLFPGVASSINVMIISEFISDKVAVEYLLFFFAVTTFIYIVTIRISKRQTASLGVLIAHKFNLLIVNKVFKIPFKKYEDVQSGKIYTILNDDINSIFSFSQNVVNVYTTLITTIMVLVYMFTLSTMSTLLLLAVTIVIMGMMILMSKPMAKTGHRARVKREGYTNLISGLINGFKELVLHKIKRDKFQKDLEIKSKESYNASQANINLGIDAALFSELSFTIAVGISCLVFPLIFNFEKELITAYVIAVLFLWGPVGALINGVPQVVNVKVSYKRIKAFLNNALTDEISENHSQESITITDVENIQVKNVTFNYQKEDEEQGLVYGIGPVNFEANRGELVFIVGGNGSGKTTFLKLLIGLYEPDSGQILINGKNVTSQELSECFSVIYSDFYLFKKLYDIKEYRLEQVYEWLDVLQLSEKVKIEDGIFSTIDLSKGQRKRLAILKSYLEDRPVYFFDEVAADLDPEFRSFFYNDLLTKMREEGKILIIISHDDKYFKLADNVFKMDMGILKSLNEETLELTQQY